MKLCLSLPVYNLELGFLSVCGLLRRDLRVVPPGTLISLWFLLLLSSPNLEFSTKTLKTFKRLKRNFFFFLYECGIQISDRFEINWTVKKALKGLYLIYHLRLNTVWHFRWIDVRAMVNILNEPQKFPGMPQKSKQLECIRCQLKKRLNLVNKFYILVPSESVKFQKGILDVFATST